MNVIACIGEHLSEREAGRTMKVCRKQLSAIRSKINHSLFLFLRIAFSLRLEISHNRLWTCLGNRNWKGCHTWPGSGSPWQNQTMAIQQHQQDSWKSNKDNLWGIGEGWKLPWVNLKERHWRFSDWRGSSYRTIQNNRWDCEQVMSKLWWIGWNLKDTIIGKGSYQSTDVSKKFLILASISSSICFGMILRPSDSN